MESSPSRRTISTDERAYLYARGMFLAAMTAIYFFVAPAWGPDSGTTMFLVALGISTAGTIGLLAAVFMWDVPVARAMIGVLPVDLVSVSAFVFLGLDGDWFYPVCVLIPVAYALIVRKREAWMVGAATAIAYISAYAFSPAFTASTYLMFAFKALTIPLVGTMVASAVAKQHSREAQLARAIEENLEITERLQRRVSELQAVSEITEVIHSSLDFDNVGPVVLDIVARLVDIESCCLFIIDKQRSETIFSASVGSVAQASGQGPGALRDTDMLDEHFTCTSVFDRGSIMVMFCARAEDVERLSDEDSLIVGAVASELVVAVENSRLYKLTKRLAITDELTGLFNYRHLQQRLDEETARALRYRKQVSLLMLDVDDFKGFNDSYGHIAGDVALAELATVIMHAVREVDVVARYGGEEFSVLLPETDAAGAFSTAEKVREAVAVHQFANADGERCCKMTVSIGLATLPAHAYDKETLLKEADNALYAAKNGGKNRVRSSQTHLPLPETMQPTGDLQ